MIANTRRIFRRGLLITSGTFMSRVMGLVRELLAAMYFGSSGLYDAFVIAFSVPNLFRRVLGEEMFERAFMPPFNRLRAAGQTQKARAMLMRQIRITLIALVVATTLLYLVLPWLIPLLAPGMESELRLLSIRLARYLLPFLILISAAAYLSAIALYSGHDMLYGFAPSIQNLVIIIILVALYQSWGIMALTLAFLLGALAYVLMMLPAAISEFRQLQKHPESNSTTDPGMPMREGSKIFASATIEKSVDIIDRLIASLVGPGAIAALWFSRRIIDLPVTLFSKTLLSLPVSKELSDLQGSRDRDGFSAVLTMGIKANILILTPVLIFMMFYAEEIITLIYKRGHFGAESVSSTTLAFFWFSLAVLPIGLRGFFNRVYGALENNRVPLIASLTGAIINVILALILYRTTLRHGGIALATSVSYMVQILVMLFWLPRFGIHLKLREMLRTLMLLGFALLFFIPIIWVVSSRIPAQAGFLQMLLYLLAGAIPAFGVYALIVYTAVKQPANPPLRIALTGGGTGGHVYPTLAMAEVIRQERRVDTMIYLGIQGRAEEKIVPRRGIPLHIIRSAPLAGRSPGKILQALWHIGMGTLQSLALLTRHRINLVIGAGGYVSAPVVTAAFLLKPFRPVHIILNEQNIIPGTLNQAASLMADLVLVNFRESSYFIWSNRCVHSGYPVRREFLEPGDQPATKRELGLDQTKLLVLVTGGSLGARAINEALIQALPHLQKRTDLQIVHSIGLNDSEDYHAWPQSTRALAALTGVEIRDDEILLHHEDGSPFYRAVPFLHDMVRWQQAADLVISRAGAGTLAEIMALGKAALVIPKRGLPGDHQELNAIELRQKGAIDTLFEYEDADSGRERVDAIQLQRQLEFLLERPEQRQQLGAAAQRQASRHFAEILLRSLHDLETDRRPDLISTIEEPQFVRFQRNFDFLVQYLDGRNSNDPYRRYYETRVDRYLQSDHFLQVNSGIKLIGSLQLSDRYPFIYEHYGQMRGFLRRNSLTALRKADQFEEEFSDLIRAGLSDDYFEVRREAIRLYIRFHDSLQDHPEIHHSILERLDRRRESYEVKSWAIQAAVRFLSEDEFLTRMKPFRAARNLVIREGLVTALDEGLRCGLFTDFNRVKKFIQGILITTSDFEAIFHIRQRYLRMTQRLEQPHD